jgi:hypothetical protein
MSGPVQRHWQRSSKHRPARAFSIEKLADPCTTTFDILAMDMLDIVNLRVMLGIHGPTEGSIVAPLMVLGGLQRQVLASQMGLSNVCDLHPVNAARRHDGSSAVASMTRPD